ncbi:MAG: hypothetical protein NTW55_08455 [Planctomycetota bacterium]|nr:hypothetical protein [Planctomycetota bacterium]
MGIISPDTTIEASAVEIDILRKMDVSQRAEMTFQLGNNLREIVESGVRFRHPDYDDRKINMAVLRIFVGDKIFRQIYGDIEVAL